MPRKHDLGPFFVSRFSYPSSEYPLIDKGNTQETTWPFRKGHSLVFRLPFMRHGFVVGLLTRALPIDEAMRRAMGGELIGYQSRTRLKVENGGIHVAEEAEESSGEPRGGGQEIKAPEL